ncbi:T9SS type A sorting domain-containing protein [Flavobacterium sp.]
MKTHYLILSILLIFSSNVNAQLQGTLANTFNQQGWNASVFGNNNGFYINKTLIQPDGKILVCAEGYYPNEATQAVVVRYNSDGSVDSTFGGGDGIVRSKDDSEIDLWTHSNGMGIQSTGKIIIAGDGFTAEERIFRLNADGSLDASFGINGVVNRGRPNGEFIYHVGIQSDNKIIICGEERRTVNGILEPHVFLWRFTENGILDTSFGSSGVVSYHSTAWINSVGAMFILNDLIILPDDKILINQSFTKAPYGSVMLRKFNADGSSDTSFGANGEAIKNVVSNYSNYKYSSSAVQQNGAIITSITVQDEINNSYTESIFRMNALGEIDPTFNINLENPTNFPESMQIKTCGDQVYIVKKLDQSGYSFDEILCYDSYGNVITAFGDNGIYIINQNDIPRSYLGKAAISPSGNIYLLSNTTDPNNSANTIFLAANVMGFNPNLSVYDIISSDKTVIYPNPTTGFVSISSLDHNVIEKVEILDSLGKIILTETANPFQINLSTISSGLYIFKIYSDEVICQEKVVKQ